MIVEARNHVSKRTYPELLKTVEQITHDRIDDAYPDKGFTHRGQEWHEEGEMLVLEVWAVSDGLTLVRHDLGRF